MFEAQYLVEGIPIDHTDSHLSELKNLLAERFRRDFGPVGENVMVASSLGGEWRFGPQKESTRVLPRMPSLEEIRNVRVSGDGV